MDERLMFRALEAQAQSLTARRDFFRFAGGVAAAAAGLAAMAGGDERLLAAAEAQTAAPSDADVLNFALNFEYLEANFYSYVVTGSPIAASYTGGVGTQGAATGGAKVAFNDPVIANFAAELLRNELAHINFLKTQLASAAIAQPAIDLGTSPTSAFSMAAQAAGVVGAGQSYNPYADENQFLVATFLFVEVGTSAYQGGAGLLTNKTYLEAAAGILAAEAYHSGATRNLLYNKGLQMPALITAANKVSDARDSLDGPTDDDIPLTVNGTPNFVPTDSNGLTFPRTPGQVLNIGYLNKAAVTKGGFYPNGVNGTVNTSAASG